MWRGKWREIPEINNPARCQSCFRYLSSDSSHLHHILISVPTRLADILMRNHKAVAFESSATPTRSWRAALSGFYHLPPFGRILPNGKTRRKPSFPFIGLSRRAGQAWDLVRQCRLRTLRWPNGPWPGEKTAYFPGKTGQVARPGIWPPDGRPPRSRAGRPCPRTRASRWPTAERH
jgi:hypothetical protein